MGVSIKAEAMSHLEHISDEGIEGMARNASTAVILPTTAHILRLKPPPVRKMIEAGVPIALGSDFNPNAFCLSMVTRRLRHMSIIILVFKRRQKKKTLKFITWRDYFQSRIHSSCSKGMEASPFTVPTTVPPAMPCILCDMSLFHSRIRHKKYIAFLMRSMLIWQVRTEFDFLCFFSPWSCSWLVRFATWAWRSLWLPARWMQPIPLDYPQNLAPSKLGKMLILSLSMLQRK